MTLLSYRPAVWGGIALSGFLLSALALISLHFLRPNYSPRDNFVSEYAVGPYGYVMTTAFVVLGLSSLALAMGMRAAQDSPYSRLFDASLKLAAAGLFVMAACQTDLNDLASRSRVGSIHDSISVVTFFFGVIAMGLFAWKVVLPDHSPLLKLQSPTHLLTIACSLLLMTQLCLVGIQQGHRPYLWVGIPERALIALFLPWASLLSHCMLTAPHTDRHG